MMDEGFEDFYEDLQVSPNADQETIERVYRLLAKRYHPDNNGSGSVEKFDIVTRAYKILSQPEKRAAYDATYSEKKERRWQAFAQAEAPGGFTPDAQIRRQILSVLYIERRQDPEKAGVGTWRLAQYLGWPEKTLEFHVWYLKEKHWIERTDTGGFAITAAGVDEMEKEGGVVMGEDRLLPETAGTGDPAENILLLEHIGPATAGNLKEAIANLNRRVADNPQNLSAWVFLANLYSRLGNMSLAAAAVESVRRIDPRFSAEEFLGQLKFKTEEGRARFREYSKLAGL